MMPERTITDRRRKTTMADKLARDRPHVAIAVSHNCARHAPAMAYGCLPAAAAFHSWNSLQGTIVWHDARAHGNIPDVLAVYVLVA